MVHLIKDRIPVVEGIDDFYDTAFTHRGCCLVIRAVVVYGPPCSVIDYPGLDVEGGLSIVGFDWLVASDTGEVFGLMVYSSLDAVVCFLSLVTLHLLGHLVKEDECLLAVF